MSCTSPAVDAGTLQVRLVAMLADHLECPPEDVDIHASFSRYGASSRTITAVLAELGRELGRPLSVTLAWEHPSVAELAAALSGEPAPGTTERRGRPGPDSRAAPAQGASDPVAIVGLACRFPGATSPDRFFDMLERGVDAVRELDPARFDLGGLYDRDPDAPGRASTRWAGLLDAVDGFDAPFFGISRREAIHMDPQQRLILELAWEALEDAGLPPRELRGTRTGVFVGAMWSDYAATRRGSLEAIAQHTAVGEDLSIIPARVSYALGLAGPSLAVNTACSSSLVALHLGCQSVQSGESTVALVGGVNLLLAPDSFVAMSKFGAMAPDGRSKAFDARANGYVRGEGAGVVVLKRLSRARADGDRVVALVLATAVNNDGPSNGMTAPNPRAQEAVLRDAHARAGVAPEEVAFIETHGTGTLLGDPIEANAIGQVLGVHRRGAPPLWLGAVKTSIGHLEAAAGMAGLIKTCLALRRGRIPPNLHFETPNPHVDFQALGLAVPTRPMPWPVEGGRRVAGVSSFGFGGTNAHAVLASDPDDDPALVRLEAVDLAALRETAGAAAAALARGELPAGVEARAGATARGAGVRAALTGASRAELARRLRAFAGGGPEDVRPAAGAGAAARSTPGRTLFVFGPNGSQHRGMVRTLLADPVFARAFDACDAACSAWLDWSLRDELLHGTDEARLDRIDVGQPLLFAVQAALAAWLEAHGCAPDAVLGHSVGEVAAAYTAGALDMADAARVVVHRSRLMQLAAGKGAMALVELPPDEVERALAALGGGVEIAGYNGPRSTAVSGDADRVAGLLDDLVQRGVETHRIRRTDIGAHSAHMDPYVEPLREALAGMHASPGRMTIYSTVLGDTAPGSAQDADYWPRNLREPVRFEQTLRRALADGFSAVVEISPHPLLARSIGEVLAERGERGAAAAVLAAQHRDLDSRAALLEVVAELHRAGLSSGASAPTAAPDLFLVSAATAPALAEVARRCADAVAASAAPLAASCHSSRARRSHHAMRAAVVADSPGELAAVLRRLAEGVDRVGCRAAPREVGKLAFVFSGQGPQWWGMGRELIATEPVFRGTVAACDRLIQREAGWSLLGELAAEERASRVHEVEVTQPALFALQAGLFGWLRAHGVHPDAVVGHSLGEIGAAYAAGVLSLPEAVHMTVARARAMRGAVGRGRMLAADIAAEEVDLRRFGERVALAAVNGPRAAVFAGEPGPLAELASELEARGVHARLLRGQLAFHSRQMRPARSELLDALSHLRPRAARIPLVSTALGRPVGGEEQGPAYWADQVVAPVRFADAIDALIRSGHTTFLEIGPHPTLVAATLQCLEARGVDGVCTPTLRREKPERACLLEALGELHVAGRRVDLPVRSAASLAHAPLPGYPWQHRRYWLEMRTAPDRVASVPAIQAPDAVDAVDAMDAGDAGAEAGDLRLQLQAADDRTRRALLEERIGRRVAAILLLDASEPVDPTQGFLDLGMDSLMVMRLRQDLQRDLGRPLAGPIMFDHPSVRRLAAHLAAAGDIAPVAVASAQATADRGPTRRGAPRSRAEDLTRLTRDDLERSLLDELDDLDDLGDLDQQTVEEAAP